MPRTAMPPERLHICTGYWNFRGLGAPMRMMCKYAGLGRHEDIKYEVFQRPRGSGWIAPEWERRHKPELREQNPFVTLPYVLNHSTGENVFGAMAVYLYLARILDLIGRTERQRSENEEALAYLHTIQVGFSELCYPFRSCRDYTSFEDAVLPYMEETVPPCYEWLETRLFSPPGALKSNLRERPTARQFLASDDGEPCACDFVALEVLEQHEALARAYALPSPLEEFVALSGFYKRMRHLPRLQGYFDSCDATLPINNKMAFFK
eukprot:TRINITY_DN26532_c0_g1_i1.p1 TRINITY_DN26532_c0_g1~~TRINITY_DN26532_c0_g1_i1.p1  ORF type:complete len:265 (+),score=42.97 TRINITY_DN26532_c0_g1_i1:181-975(+)